MAGRVRQKLSGNLLPFPGFDPMFEADISEQVSHDHPRLQIADMRERKAIGGIDDLDVVLCGTYRKDVEGLRRSFEQLKDLGFNVLSPTNVDVERKRTV